MEGYMELKVEAETFEKMRNDANFVLQRALGAMAEKESFEGKVTINLDIKMIREYIPNYDPDAHGETRAILKPKFEHKVTSAINIKNEKKGSTEPEMAMEWDEGSKSYVLTYVNNTEQRSIFDSDFEAMNRPDGYDESGGENGYQEPYLIEGPIADGSALPGPVGEDEEWEQPRSLYGDGDKDAGYGYEDVG